MEVLSGHIYPLFSASATKLGPGHEQELFLRYPQPPGPSGAAQEGDQRAWSLCFLVAAQLGGTKPNLPEPPG